MALYMPSKRWPCIFSSSYFISLCKYIYVYIMYSIGNSKDDSKRAKEEEENNKDEEKRKRN